MSQLYKITGRTSSSPGDHFPSVEISSKDRLLRSTSPPLIKDRFSSRDTEDDFWEHIRSQSYRIIRPFRSLVALINIGVIAFLSLLLNFLWKLNEPLVRGWRLRVVRQVALGKRQPVPGSRPDLLVRYYLKGLVLIFSRWVYFIPLLIVALFSGSKMLRMLGEVFWFFWEKLTSSEDTSVVEFFVTNIIPQFGVQLIVQLVVLTLYTVFVWPVYRIIMIKYAVGEVRGWAFFSVREIKDSIKIFRQHASKVYGVFGFVLSIDVLFAWFSWTIGWAIFFILPIIAIFFRHWIKGYAYGLLGRELIDRGVILAPGYENTPHSTNLPKDTLDGIL